MKHFFVRIPSGSKTIDAVETWGVFWWARIENICDDSKLCWIEQRCQFFTDKQLAREFKESLEAAFMLIGDSHMTTVRMVKELRS